MTAPRILTGKVTCASIGQIHCSARRSSGITPVRAWGRPTLAALHHFWARRLRFPRAVSGRPRRERPVTTMMVDSIFPSDRGRYGFQCRWAW